MRNPFASPLWHNAAFVRVWTAASISIFGSLITRMALPLAAILVLGSGAFEVAVIRGLELGAMLLVGLVAGAWVDRLRRRPVLIWAVRTLLALPEHPSDPGGPPAAQDPFADAVAAALAAERDQPVGG